MHAAVGGAAAKQVEYDRIMSGRLPLLIFTMSMLQWVLERRKTARKQAAKARQARVDRRGGW